VIVEGLAISARNATGERIKITVYPSPYGFTVTDGKGVLDTALMDLLTIPSSPLRELVDSLALPEVVQ
jgi:hypothetical protein